MPRPSRYLYFSLYFNGKRNLSFCDVRFVPKVVVGRIGGERWYPAGAKRRDDRERLRQIVSLRGGAPRYLGRGRDDLYLCETRSVVTMVAPQPCSRQRSREISMGQFAKLRTQKIEGFEELNDVIVGTSRQVVQLEHGKIRGEVTHASIAGLPIAIASFNLGIRSKGGSHKDRIGIGLLAASGDHAMCLSYESRPGDVLVTQPGCEHENRYYGGASIIVVTPSVDDIEQSFATEARMSDPSAWGRNHYRGNAATLTSVVPRLRSLFARIGDASLTAEAAEFWKRGVI